MRRLAVGLRVSARRVRLEERVNLVVCGGIQPEDCRRTRSCHAVQKSPADQPLQRVVCLLHARANRALEQAPTRDALEVVRSVRVTNEIGEDFRHNFQIGPLVTTQDGHGLSNARARFLRCKNLRDLVVLHWHGVKGRDGNDRPAAHGRRQSQRPSVGSQRAGAGRIDPPVTASLHVAWIDFVPLDEAPEGAAILPRRASGLRDVALVGSQRLADELPFEIIEETCACGAEPDGLDRLRG